MRHRFGAYIDSDTVTVYTDTMDEQENAERTYTIEELADANGVSVRTVRFYISKGLLPSPFGRGRLTVYTDQHMQRLQQIRLLTDKHVPLDEIRSLVGGDAPTEDQMVDAAQEPLPEADVLVQESPRQYLERALSRARAASGLSQPGASIPVPAYARPIPRAPAPPSSASVPRYRFPGAQEPLTPKRQQAERSAPEEWQRQALVPGVELHIRKPLNSEVQKLVQAITDLAERFTSEA